MNIQEISTQLIYTTVPVVSNKPSGMFTGTGFIFSISENDNGSIPLLITNSELLEGANSGYFEFHIGENGNPTSRTIRIQFNQDAVADKKLGKLNLAALPLAGVFTELERQKIELFFRTVDQSFIPADDIFDDLSAMEEIIFIGYPNGLLDSTNKISIIRQGITATPIWNHFNGEDIFLIDGGVFPGSSGSPVFIFNRGTYPTKDGIAVGNRLLFVGVISQPIASSNTNAYLNLGTAINSKAFYRELQVLINRLKENENS